MIYLITGVPGAGKTLYAVSTLVQKLAAEKVKNKAGELVPRRVCVDGIPDLLFPHEQMAVKKEADVVDGLRGKVVQGEEEAGNGLWNWYDWCLPGDIIVIDEVQRYWRPRGMGTKPPKEIQMLETHRHFGVDFVVITQNPMLIDQNVRRLVGRHQHVRRLFGMNRAVIYDWDSCSVDVTKTKSATTTFFGYPKSAFDLYKSSELHTKQKQKIPAWLIVPVLGIVGGIFVAPTAFGALSGAMTGKGIGRSHETPVAAVAALPAASAASSPVVAAEVVPPPAPLVEKVNLADLPKIVGCVKTPTHCQCIDDTGAKANTVDGFCESHILGGSVPGSKLVNVSGVLPEYDPPPMGASESDKEVLSFMAKNRPNAYY